MGLTTRGTGRLQGGARQITSPADADDTRPGHWDAVQNFDRAARGPPGGDKTRKAETSARSTTSVRFSFFSAVDGKRPIGRHPLHMAIMPASDVSAHDQISYSNSNPDLSHACEPVINRNNLVDIALVCCLRFY